MHCSAAKKTPLVALNLERSDSGSKFAIFDSGGGKTSKILINDLGVLETNVFPADCFLFESAAPFAHIISEHTCNLSWSIQIPPYTS